MKTALLWFRRDLRLADNPALQSLLNDGYTPIPIYIHDEPDNNWPLGGASAWWLHHSLQSLKQSLLDSGSDLFMRSGDSKQTISDLILETGAEAIYWNRCYEPAFIARDKTLKKKLAAQDIKTRSFNASLLREPWEHLKKDGTPYRVFTPFWKLLKKVGHSRELIYAPQKITTLPNNRQPATIPIDSLNLLPSVNWDKHFYDHWKPGEDNAWVVLKSFCEDRLQDYKSGRDFPEKNSTSKLSAHLHFGELSPIQASLYITQTMNENTSSKLHETGEAWLRQIAWREFSYHLLYHFPQTSSEALNVKFEAFPWSTDYQGPLKRWQQGKTGVPIIDAGMRELWQTGNMHNRVRMLAASYLTKNLLIPWQEGARWFWDTLVDADLANNTMGWQWTAGCGADAAPYFRVFNPVLQGEKFDKQGRYVRRWIPEIKNLDNKVIHQPWLSGKETLRKMDYPEPIVDLKNSRLAALAAWEETKGHA